MIIEVIKQHIYLYLLILTIVEGPITSFVSAGLAAHDFLRIEYVAAIAFLGDLIGDMVFYIIGRFFCKIKFLKRFTYFSRQKTFLGRTLERSPFLFLLIAKFTPYLAMPSLIFAGAKKMKLKIYILYSFVISIFVKIVYLVLGYVGSVSVKQVQSFISGRKQIVLYILIGLFFFFLSRRIYQYIGKHLKKDLEEK